MVCVATRAFVTLQERTVLTAFESPRTPEDVAFTTDLSLYRIRLRLRELVEAELLEQVGRAFQLTPDGRQWLAESATG